MRLILFLCALGLASSTYGQEFRVQPERQKRNAFDIPTRGSASTQLPPPQSAPIVGRSSQEDDGYGVLGEVTSDYATITTCFAKLIEDIDVPAEQAGKLTFLLERDTLGNLVTGPDGKPMPKTINRGRFVRAGEVIAKIDDQLARMQLREATLKKSQAEKRANDDTAINAAQKKLRLATEEFDSTERLYVNRSKSKTEYKRAAYSMQIAQLELNTAQNEKMLAIMDSQTQQVEVDAAAASISRHEIKAPVDGYVFELKKDPGEWVQSGEPVFRVASMDRLKIQAYVESTQFNPHEIDGRKVTATFRIAGDSTEEFEGNVTFVSMENYSDKFEIEVEIQNRKYEGTDHYILRAGSEVNIRIHLGEGSIASRPRNPNK